MLHLGAFQATWKAEVWERRELVDRAVARPVMTLYAIMTLAVLRVEKDIINNTKYNVSIHNISIMLICITYIIMTTIYIPK